jgi:FSR family fosmidomycin resistance protein-like MFS transporter
MPTNTVPSSAPKTKHLVLWALCISHLFNDTFQSLIPAAFPLLKEHLVLSFTQVGLIATVFQLSSSVCQPIVGWFMDKYPQRYSLPIGMTSTMLGILLLGEAWNFHIVLIAVALIGVGSAVFHPESSRLAYMASGGRLGFAQSIFQTGGNAGSSLGPLLAAIVITPYGLKNIAWFSLLAVVAIFWMVPLSRWYGRRLKERKLAKNSVKKEFVLLQSVMLPQHKVFFAVFILLALVFSKNLYTVSFSNFFTFYLMERYGVSVQHSQFFLFAFLLAAAIGTIVGGPIGDKIGRKPVIWFSILGAAPFALLLPYVHSLWATCALSMVVGAIMASSFPAILIFAQELMPGRVGTVGGLFFGFSFGAGAIASALLGGLADHGGGVMFVYNLCAYMPLIGLITWFLPNIPKSLQGGK